MTCQTLFVSRFGVEYLPLMYLTEAGILPLQLWAFNLIARRFSQGKLIKILYTVITSVLMACAGFLLLMFFIHIEFRFFYPVLFILSNVLARILVPVTWMLGDGVCRFQQAKRLFPLLGALFTLGAILAGIVARVMAGFVSGFGTELTFMIMPVVLLASTFLWRRVITDYFLDTELDDTENDNESTMTSVITAIWSSPFLKTALISMVILLSLFYILDYQFFVFIAAKYPGSDEMTRYFGFYVAVLYTVSLLVGLLLNRIFKRFGMGNVVLGMGIIITIVLIITGIMTPTSWALNSFFLACIIIDILSFTLIPPISQVFYKLLPPEQRAGAGLLFAGTINAGGKLISSGLTGLHSSHMVTLTVLSIIGFIMAVSYLIFCWKQKRLYLSTLMQSMQSRSVAPAEWDSFSPGKLLKKTDLSPVLEAMQSNNSCRQSIALELSAEINSVILLPYIRPFLTNPDPRFRLLALKALSNKNIDKSEWENIWLNCLSDPEEEIRWEAVKHLREKDFVSGTITKALQNSLSDSSHLVVSEAVISLAKLGEEKAALQYCENIAGLSEPTDKELGQLCRIIAATGMQEYAKELITFLKRESSQLRISAVQALGKLSCTEAVNEITELYPTADLALKKEIEKALHQMGKKAIPVLLALLGEKDTDIWYLGIISTVSLEPDAAICRTLEESCIQKLTSFNAIKAAADLMNQSVQPELAELYKLRLQELSALILKACWKVLAFSLDPIVLEKIYKAVNGKDTEKKEQAIEVLCELSVRYPLVKHMLTLLAGAEEEQQLPEESTEVLKKSMQDFPDSWLDRFTSYVLLKNEKRVS